MACQLRRLVSVVAITLLSSLVSLVEAQQTDPFALGVRESDPLTAQQEQATFRLPPGFTIKLVAAEPQIAKPMNLAFDTRGRLWVSSSEEYPFAAKEGSVARDTIKILEDIDGDGLADKVTTFADQLNIPIGLYPYKDGVICFSIPNILFLRDTDGDDVCDIREVLYGPFDTTRDTHGMNNSFRRGQDGWIYACHGFNNRSSVQGRDGNIVSMSSGNTYRFKPDGSRIEHFTYGQVNPFGMAIDQFDDVFTADCHTKPVTLLLQGGYYDSFGKPHDGLGYVPGVMNHLHGSTAIGGIALGEHTSFPAEFQDSSFGGNVMTSRINRNTLQRIGSTVQAVEQPDLLSSTDPWFRPVDMVAGPDGSLYVADFYNRIIGHYEVDLNHPGRDRHRGRIWKITYTGDVTHTGDNVSSPSAPAAHDVTKLLPTQLVDRLSKANYQTAQMIADHVADRLSADAETLQQVLPLLQSGLSAASPVMRLRSLRLLQRMHQLDFTQLIKATVDPDPLVRVHAFRTLNAVSQDNMPGYLPADVLKQLRQGFQDSSPMVRRAAVIAAARHQDVSLIRPLMRLLQAVPVDDVHLRHAVRMTLRDHLRDEGWFRQLTLADQSGHESLTAAEVALLGDLCLALKTPAAGEFIAANLAVLAKSSPEQLADLVQFAAAWVSPESAAFVAQTARREFLDDEALQLNLLESMATGLRQRGMTPPAPVRDWAESLALKLLGMSSTEDLQSLRVVNTLPWQFLTHPDFQQESNPWTVSFSRRSADGLQNTPLYSSFEKGEQQTGIYRSSPFELSERFSFYVSGHDGIPSQPLKGNNFIRLRDASTGKLLLETPPRRNDVAQLVEWDTSRWQGQLAEVELVDGDNSSAYAWLAVGRFSDERLNPGHASLQRERACQLITTYRLHSLQSAVEHLIRSENISRSEVRILAATLAALHPDSRLEALSLVPSVAGVSAAVIVSCAEAMVSREMERAADVIGTAAKVATSAEQLRMAEPLAADQVGATLLVSLIEDGQMSAGLLNRPTVQQKLAAFAGGELQRRIATLTASLPDENAAIEQLIARRRAEHAAVASDPIVGAELFKKNCSICHQIAGEGKQVGPNLDGIGNRGLDRIVEDVLAPNRNVDVAFRTSTVVSTDGQAFSGLVRDLEGNRLSIVDSQGKETLLPNSEVEERIQSVLSPMPANVSEILNEAQFHDLLAYLMSLRQ